MEVWPPHVRGAPTAATCASRYEAREAALDFFSRPLRSLSLSFDHPCRVQDAATRSCQDHGEGRQGWPGCGDALASGGIKQQRH
jgi:hypothetical protein